MSRWHHIRQISAIIACPAVGLLAGRLVSVTDTLLRSKPPIEDDAALRAQAIVEPLVIPAFVLFCAIYILPAAWVLRRLARLNFLFTAVLITLPVWILSSVALNAPQLGERVWQTAVFLTGPVFALPVLCSSLVAGAAWEPNPED